MISATQERYRRVRRIGAGATGTVDLAEDVRDGSLVALKVLSPELARDPEAGARFAREATACRAIADAHVARAIDFGCEPDGRPWLATEWVDGRSLREVLVVGALPPERALRIARQVLEALAAAHDAGVIHRDIKPENVIVAAGDGFDEDHVKVVDFGIAKLDRARHGVVGPDTSAGVVPGTPTYMAPEQIRREGVDGRADLYAVGVVLFEMITGAPPFAGDDVTVLARHLTQPPPSLTSPMASASLTLALRALVGRLLAKSRDARPAHARAAIEELDGALASIRAESAVEALSLRTGGVMVAPLAEQVAAAARAIAAAQVSAPPPAPAAAENTPPRSPAQAVTKPRGLAGWAEAYGLQPRQLVYAAVVAFGLFALVLVVAIAS